MNFAFWRAALTMTLLSTMAWAQTPFRVRDSLSAGTRLRSTDAYRGTNLGGTTLFTMEQPSTGVELWATDGTAAGTRLVIDLSPGPRAGNPLWLTSFNGAAYFTASDGLGLDRLWRTDGTTTGTVPLVPLRCNVLQPAGAALFCLNDSELWRTDGTAAGTALVQTLYGNYPIYETATLGTALFFKGADGELWKSDGTSAGTARVRDLRPANSTGSLFSRLVVMGGRLYFVADDGVSGLELWSSDGTSVGTARVKDIVPGTGNGIVAGITVAPNLFVTSTRVFFFSNATNGIELWSSDGTSAGTALVADLNPGAGSTFSSTSELTAFQDNIFFSGADGELWKSDGTALGTVRVKDIPPSTRRSTPSDLQVVGAQLFFEAEGGWWRSDGTPAGTVELRPSAQLSPRQVIGSVGARAMWLADDFSRGGDLWLSDGTPAGTVALGDFSPGFENTSSSPAAMARLGTALLFMGQDGAGRQNLFTTDGTAAGSTLLKGGFYGVKTLVTTGPRAWFVSASNQLWTTDGTAVGTVLLRTIGAASTFGDTIYSLTLVGDRLFFLAFDTATAWEPWVSDGTAAGTRQLTGLIPNATGVSIRTLFSLNGALHFWLASSTGAALWKTNGTAAGTTLIYDVLSSQPFKFTTGALHFAANGNKVWVSDGTTAGSRALTAGTTTSEVLRLEALGAQAILFVLNENAGGRADDVAEVWVTDGTQAGTRFVSALGRPAVSNAAYYWATLVNTAVVGTRLVFPFTSATTGTDLWVTDGTAAGTHALRDLDGVGRADVAFNGDFVSAGGFVYFGASDGLSGAELWKTDGTSAGTTRVADLVPGTGSSSPRGFTVEEPFVYFSAFDAAGDEELYALDLGLDSTPPVITPTVLGTRGLNDWYTSDLTVRFTVVDRESQVTLTGCADTVLSTDFTSRTLTCSASSTGGVSMASITVKRDATPPQLVCGPAQSLEATSASGSVATFALPTATDAFGMVGPVTASLASGSAFPLGLTMVAFSARDEAGNTGSCTLPITVEDSTPPVISCPADSTVTAGTLLQARAMARDLVDASPRVTQTVSEGTVLPVGDTQVMASATDAAGNVSTCSFAVTVTPGTVQPTQPTSGCGCQAGAGAAPLWAFFLLLLPALRRRRV